MASEFRQRVIALGGTPIGRNFVMSPRVRDTFHLLTNDGGEVLALTAFAQSLSKKAAIAKCRSFLRDNPAPRVTYFGPPT